MIFNLYREKGKLIREREKTMKGLIRKFATTVAMVTAVCCLPMAVQAGTVDWTAFAAALTLQNGTSLDPATSLIRLGYFSISDSAVIAGQLSPTTLNSSFVQLQSGAVGDIGGVQAGQNGIYGESFTGDFTTTFASAAGKNIYVWAFNTTNLVTATQQGIFKWTAQYPNDIPVPGAASVDLGDLLHGGGTILVGTPGSGTVNTGAGPLEHVNMAIIPEPSSLALVGLGLFGLLGLIRQRRA
jgi:hypothetical protein